MIDICPAEPDLAPLPSLDVALDAYTYAYPLIAIDTMRRMATSVPKADVEHGRGAPINQFSHLRHIPHVTSARQRPSADTLPSWLWFDVASEPLIITLPDAEDRFYSISMRDAWGDAFAAAGTQTTGTRAQRFAIVGPFWRGSLPRGIRVYRSPTVAGCLSCLTELRGPVDLPHAARFQASLSAAPWSKWGQLFSAPGGAAMILASAPDVVRAVSLMRAEHYFTRFCELARRNPPHAHDHAMLDRLRRIGLVPGRSLRFGALPESVQAALEQAVLVAPIRLEAAHARLRTRINQWHVAAPARGAYGTDYTVRAAVAFGGLGPGSAEDLLMHSTGQDAAGDAFDSSRRYVLRFGRGQRPPVHAFWSLTLYDDRRGFADNELQRHALGSRDDLAVDADGALSIVIQRERPAPELVRSWLPAPRSGGFNLCLRSYAPGTAARDGIWVPPAVRRVEERRAAQRPTLLRLERPGA